MLVIDLYDEKIFGNFSFLLFYSVFKRNVIIKVNSNTPQILSVSYTHSQTLQIYFSDSWAVSDNEVKRDYRELKVNAYTQIRGDNL